MSDPMETGDQPCDDFDPGEDAMYNYHECPGCSKIRRFCDKCITDHHSGGWDTCEAPPRQKRLENKP